MNNLIASSSDKDKVSATIEGGVVVLVSALIVLASNVGSGSEMSSVELIPQVTEISGYIVGALGAFLSLYGAIRRLFNRLS